MTDSRDRETALHEIVERELSMFLATPNEGGVSACQQRPDAFRLMRRMAHVAHGDAVLFSYLEDLRRAETEGRNLMIEKYARMDDRIPPLSANPLLDEIADAETEFLHEACQLYPNTIKSNGQNMFRRYLRCELETLSPETLELYAAELRQARAVGANPAVTRHDFLTRTLGKGGIETCEAAAEAARKEH